MGQTNDLEPLKPTPVLTSSCMLAVGCATLLLYWASGPQITSYELERSAIRLAPFAHAFNLVCMLLACLIFATYAWKRGSPGRSWFLAAAIGTCIAGVFMVGYRVVFVESPAMRAHFDSLNKNERDNDRMAAALIVVRDELARLQANGGGGPADLAMLGKIIEDRIPADFQTRAVNGK
ncbi:MAG: hypothetical protein KF805_06930 [Phycisphaeraceae bacterium]|nr:hypothetical protein [Phycisphaeraceae bacterium]